MHQKQQSNMTLQFITDQRSEWQTTPERCWSTTTLTALKALQSTGSTTSCTGWTDTRSTCTLLNWTTAGTGKRSRPALRMREQSPFIPVSATYSSLPGIFRLTSEESVNRPITENLTGIDPIKILQRKFYATQFFKHSDWLLKFINQSEWLKISVA